MNASTPSQLLPRVVARIVAIGDELLSGDTVNSNATTMATRCRRLGIVVDRVITVRDRQEEIVSALREASDGAAVCFVCGGLGPTTDDLTTVAIAAAAGVEVERDAAALDRLEKKFASFGREMPPANRKQADFPTTATVLANPIGTAEGFSMPLGDSIIFVMPGVPREMRRMFDEQVSPVLQERFRVEPTPRRMYRTLGRGESSLAKVVEPIVAAARERSAGLASMFVHYRASTPEVLVILEATPGADGIAATEEELRSLDAELLPALEPAVYGIGETELPQRVVTALDQAGLTMSTAESCTGGGIGRRIASVAGASNVFGGGTIAYANSVKEQVLGVDAALLREHGAVSEATAKAMAQGGRAATRSDLCVAVTGIAGPGGGTPEKPVGTVHIDVFDGEAHVHQALRLRGNRGTVQHCSELWALKLVWDRLCARGLAAVSPTP